MTVTLESTRKIVEVRLPTGAFVPARIWEGQTADGVAVHAYITRLAVGINDCTPQFETEFYECRAPSPDVEALPLRMIL